MQWSRLRLQAIGVTAAATLSLAGASPAAAQAARPAQGTTITGRLMNSLTLEPVPGVAVVIEELRREARADASAQVTFANVPPGDYHLYVRADGFSTRRMEVAVGTEPLTFDFYVDPELHYTEVVSVGPDARSAFEAYQPTSVLSGQELAKQLESSLGATIANEPGVAQRSLGPVPSRPVIRGLDGDRVLILEDGQRTGDLSSQSGDHGVAVNPAAASRIEVVRGPATLLYGANAIGGLVNVITDRIPDEPIRGYHGGFIADFGSAATEGGAAADMTWGDGRFAVHAGGTGRRSGDVSTPGGDVDNTQSRTGSASVGASWTGERAWFGGSYGYDDTKYGVPVVEGGEIELTPRRHQFSLRSGGRNLDGFLSSYRATFGVRRYRHDELEGTEIGTTFRNDTIDFEFLGGHRQFGRLSGSVGVAVNGRRFESAGEEALAPPVDQRGAAVFAYEEVAWPHFTVQFGGRVEHASLEPEGGLPDRSFTNVSASAGFLYRPAAASDRVVIAGSLARAQRNPALEELYFFGEHAGNFAFEIGNPTLGAETGIGFDLSVRWQSRRITGEVTYFRNAIDDFIFRRPLDEAEIASRFGDEVSADEFSVIEFTASDSVLSGVEAHADVPITGRVTGEVGFDYVRGTNRVLETPLPRMPPLRVRGGLRYQRNAFQAGGEVVVAAKQDRIFDTETSTDGYGLLKLFAAYSWATGKGVSTLSGRVDNVTNELYRNHLSYIKDVVPEIGRNVRVLYELRF